MIKNVIIIAGLLALLGFGYYLFVLQDASVQRNNVVVSSQAQVEAQTFLSRLNELQRIDLQLEFFSDPRFLDRTNRTTEPDFVPSGRTNPFASTN